MLAYEINGIFLVEVAKEYDLRVTMLIVTLYSNQYAYIAVLGIIKRTFSMNDNKIVVQLH